jgi:S-adenosylmethionine hydrolase
MRSVFRRTARATPALCSGDVTSSFAPCGVITLTTDIGHKGPFVATMKGVILTRFPAARVIDLTHEIDVHFPAEAGFWLARAYRWFPPGTVHVAVIDPGTGTGRDVIAVLVDGHAFLAPDNGLLASLADRPSARVYTVDLADPRRLELGPISHTFHGRDVFAPIGADLASGRRKPERLGKPADTVIPSWIEDPAVTQGVVHGVVVTFDHFGNLITNVSGEHLARFRRPVVHAGGQEFEVRRTYGDAKPGEFLALVNSFDALELACAEQSAAERLGLGRGAPVEVRECSAG